jgi:hypothetical protein
MGEYREGGGTDGLKHFRDDLTNEINDFLGQ